MEAARENDWAAVRALIGDGKASPFDQDPMGGTLLDLAAFWGHYEACEFLLEAGLDPSYDSMLRPVVTLEIMSRRVETSSLLFAAYPDVLEFPEGWHRRRHFTMHPPSLLRRLQEMMYPPYESHQPLLRAAMAMNTFGLYPQNVYNLLGPDLTLTSALQLVVKAERPENHMTLTGNALEALLRYKHDDSNFAPELKLRWGRVISTIIDFEHSNTNFHWFKSLYFHYIKLKHDLYSKQELHTLISDDLSVYSTSLGRELLKLLQSCGVDLDRYGRAERFALQQNRYARCLRLYGNWHSSNYGVSLRYLTTSPRIKDWKIYVVPCSMARDYLDDDDKCGSSVAGHDEYEMAGGFWYWIENPELFGVPGANTETEEEEEGYTCEQDVFICGPIF